MDGRSVLLRGEPAPRNTPSTNSSTCTCVALRAATTQILSQPSVGSCRAGVGGTSCTGRTIQGQGLIHYLRHRQ